MRGWAVDRDYLFREGEYEGARPRVGYGQREEDAESSGGLLHTVINMATDLKAAEVEDAVRFRSQDEDGEAYYGGAVTCDWITGEKDLAYWILKWAETDAGATVLEFKVAEPRKYEDGRTLVKRHRDLDILSEKDEWVMVYG